MLHKPSSFSHGTHPLQITNTHTLLPDDPIDTGPCLLAPTFFTIATTTTTLNIRSSSPSSISSVIRARSLSVSCLYRYGGTTASTDKVAHNNEAEP